MTRARRAIPVACAGAVVAISVLDWMTPAGVVVGIFLSVPIIVASLADDVREVWAVALLAHLGFVAAALLGRGPISPAANWIPNRIFTTLTLLSSTGIALWLRSQRLTANRARDHAVAAGDLSRLLMSLIAHDLRSPLVVAAQGVDYVLDAPRETLDPALLRELRSRLERGLRAVEVVLEAARQDLATEELGRSRGIQEVIQNEVEAFREAAAAEGKELRLCMGEGAGRPLITINRLVLRQVLGVLLDNAIRHASPGRVEVDASVAFDRLELRVADSGPGFRSDASETSGSGLGLQLARSLATFAGGELVAERNGPDGTCMLARLPLRDDLSDARPP